MIIRSLKHENEECRKKGYRNWVQWGLIERGFVLRPDWEHPKGVAKAAVSKGRWYIKCPGKTCDVNIPIDELHQLVFCADCMNVENDFKPYRVEWPDIGVLCDLLGERKDYRQRNYLPHLGETFKDLAEENKELVNGIYYP